jgi:hypothetical protein
MPGFISGIQAFGVADDGKAVDGQA